VARRTAGLELAASVRVLEEVVARRTAERELAAPARVLEEVAEAGNPATLRAPDRGGGRWFASGGALPQVLLPA